MQTNMFPLHRMEYGVAIAGNALVTATNLYWSFIKTRKRHHRRLTLFIICFFCE